MTSLYNQSRDIMDRFDFEKVQKVMSFLNWHWVSTGGGVPSIDQLKATALQLMDYAIQGYEESANKAHSYSTATGGFEATVAPYCGKARVTLLFYVDERSGFME